MESIDQDSPTYGRPIRSTNRPLATLVVRLLGTDPFLWVGNKVFDQYVPMFMMHRFSVPEQRVVGHDPEFVRWSLEYLRKRKFNFVSIEQVVSALSDGEPLPPRAISFSLDDGYWDQFEIGADLFAAYDCPATYFVTTGFIDGENWPWWSKVEHLVETAGDSQFGNFTRSLGIANSGSNDRELAAAELVAGLKSLPIEEMNSRISEWAVALEVDLPIEAPQRYAAAAWSDIRATQRKGQHVGPHTYSHPILANETEQRSYNEIKRSRDDVERELGSFANVFCYPVGRQQDFGRRERDFARELGFSGGVGAVPGTVDMNDQDSVFALQRYGFPDSKMDVIQYATWIEVFKSKVR